MPKKKKDAADNIPSAIRKQAEKATQLQKDLADGIDPAAPIVDPVDPAPAADPVQDPDPILSDPVQKDPAPAADPVQFVPPVISDPSADDYGYKGKYDALKGKYDSEIPSLAKEVESLKVVIATLQETAKVAEASVQAPAAPAVQQSNIQHLNPEDFNGYGDDIVTMAKAFNSLIDQNAQLVAKINTPDQASTADGQRLERLEANVQKTVDDRYYEDLMAAVPDWKMINRAPQFDKWLLEIDPFTMVPRNDLLQHAASVMNAQQVANIFNAFKRDHGMPTNAPVTVDNPAPAQPTVANDHLSGQLMPTSGLAPENELQPSGVKVIYPTTTQFNQATRDFATKKITEEEFNDIANRYQLAIKAGKRMP